MKNEKTVGIEQVNKVYFKSLANTRASAVMMITRGQAYFCSRLQSFVLFV